MPGKEKKKERIEKTLMDMVHKMAIPTKRARKETKSLRVLTPKKSQELRNQREMMKAATLETKTSSEMTRKTLKPQRVLMPRQEEVELKPEEAVLVSLGAAESHISSMMLIILLYDREACLKMNGIFICVLLVFLFIALV